MNIKDIENAWKLSKSSGAESPDEIVEDSIEMGIANIKSIAKHLQALVVLLQAGNDECLAEPWVQEKLTLSRDYIMSVHDYVSSEQGDEEDEEDEEEDSQEISTGKNK